MTAEPTPPASRLDRLRGRLAAYAGAKGSPRRVIVRNGLWESSGFVVYAAVMFFLSPFIVHRLGDSLYGVWEMVISLTGFLGFADIGVRPAAVHYIARYEAQKDYDALNRFVNSAFVTFAAAGLLILAVAVPLALFLPRFWDMAPGFEQEASLALLIVAAELALTRPLDAFSAVLVGKQRYDRLGQIRLAMLAVRTVGIVLVLSHGLGLVALASVVAGTGVLQMVGFTVSAFRLEPSLRFAPRLASREALGKLFRFGGWAMAVIVGLQVIWATDSLVIGRAISAAAVAFFAVGFKLAYYARDLLRVASRVVEPATGALHGLGDREGIRRLLVKSVQVMLLLSGPILVYLLVVGKPFLRTWMGPPYDETSWGVLFIITLGVLPAIASAPLAAVHYGTNRVRPLALLVALEALLNLGLSIALVGPHGIEGVALGTAIPAWLIHAFLLPYFLCRHYGIPWMGLVVRSWLGPLLVGGLAYVGLRLLVDPEATYGWGTLFALAVASVLLYAAIALVVRRLAPALLGRGPLLKVEVPETAP